MVSEIYIIVHSVQLTVVTKFGLKLLTRDQEFCTTYD